MSIQCTLCELNKFNFMFCNRTNGTRLKVDRIYLIESYFGLSLFLSLLISLFFPFSLQFDVYYGTGSVNYKILFSLKTFYGVYQIIIIMLSYIGGVTIQRISKAKQKTKFSIIVRMLLTFMGFRRKKTI